MNVPALTYSKVFLKLNFWGWRWLIRLGFKCISLWYIFYMPTIPRLIPFCHHISAPLNISHSFPSGNHRSVVCVYQFFLFAYLICPFVAYSCISHIWVKSCGFKGLNHKWSFSKVLHEGRDGIAKEKKLIRKWRVQTYYANYSQSRNKLFSYLKNSCSN